jgi:hypothetical protein
VPLPLPEAPEVIRIQAALLDAVHEHPLPAVTLTLPLVAAAPTEADVAEMLYVQLGPVPACVTRNCWPAMVTEPVLELLLEFAATDKTRVPLPIPAG